MNAEGALSVKLTVDGARVADVGVASTRPVRASSVLAGRSPDEVLRLVPLLFPVCGVAHGVACARAIDAALGREVDAHREAARDLACLGEAAASHAWQLAIAWPQAAGARIDAAPARAARDALATLIAAQRADGSRDGARDAVKALVAVLDALLARDDALLAQASPATRAGFGAALTRTVAALDVGTTGALLAGDGAFAEHPEMDGAPIDVSAYARQRGADDVCAVEARHGRGLLTRLVARRAEARAAMRRLAVWLDDRREPATAARASIAPGVGAGSAETARGPLVYRVRAGPHEVDDVRVVSPTDWTFHPRGVLRRSLLDADATGTLARDAGWLVLALDPCVPWTIEVRRA